MTVAWTTRARVVAVAANSITLAEDTERAAAIARQAGFPLNAQGRYPALVWMQVYR